MRLNNILYVHIPRTGGTHFEKLLGFEDHHLWPEGPGSKTYGFDPETIMGWHKKLKIMSQHATYEQMVEHDFIKNPNNHIKVTIVRNPYPRTVSLYKYFGGRTKWGSFESFLSNLERDPKTGGNGKIHKYFYQPQHGFMTLNGELAIDNIIKFENYEEDMKIFKKKYDLNIDITFNQEMQARKSEETFKKYYNKANCRKVELLYEDDFKMLNYEALSHSLS